MTLQEFLGFLEETFKLKNTDAKDEAPKEGKGQSPGERWLVTLLHTLDCGWRDIRDNFRIGGMQSCCWWFSMPDPRRCCSAGPRSEDLEFAERVFNKVAALGDDPVCIVKDDLVLAHGGDYQIFGKMVR